MEDKKFSIEIDATPSKVWETLWSDETYPQWTRSFCEGSHAITDWQEGSKVLFLDNNKDGILSTITQKIPNEYMYFKMLGQVVKGIEDQDSPDARGLAGGYENYTLTESNGKIILNIAVGGIEISNDIENYLLEAWPKALQELKNISEKA